MKALFFLIALLIGGVAHASESATVVAPATTQIELSMQQTELARFPTMLLQDLSDEDRQSSATRKGSIDHAGYQQARDSMRLARILWWGGYGLVIAGATVMLGGGLLASSGTGSASYGTPIVAGAVIVFAGAITTLSGAVLQQVAWFKGFGIMDDYSAGSASNALGIASLALLIGSFVSSAIIGGTGGLLFIASYVTAELQSTTTHAAYSRFSKGASMRAAVVPTRNGLALVGRF